MSFNRHKKLAIALDARSSYTFYEIEVEGKHPILHVRPTGEANPQYMNEMFKRSKGIARRIRSGGMSVALLEETRDIDLDLYPIAVVMGWDEDTVIDDSDQPAPFSKNNVEDFLRSLPSDIFDNLREHCGDLSNFRDGGLEDADIETISRN